MAKLGFFTKGEEINAKKELKRLESKLVENLKYCVGEEIRAQY